MKKSFPRYYTSARTCRRVDVDGAGVGGRVALEVTAKQSDRVDVGDVHGPARLQLARRVVDEPAVEQRHVQLARAQREARKHLRPS